jgi:hypothetical protein
MNPDLNIMLLEATQQLYLICSHIYYQHGGIVNFWRGRNTSAT